VKLWSTSVPARIEGVQFGFGQTCGAPNGVADRVGTDNCPFYVEATEAVLLAVKFDVWDSTRLPPWLVQSIVAE
jgi:hypothetical protein